MSRLRCHFLALVLSLTLLAGCAAIPPAAPPRAEEGRVERSLYALQLQRWGETRFSGILAVQRAPGTLRYALLDASGVKLLEARQNEGAGQEVLHVKAVVADSGLPGFLGTALERLFWLRAWCPPCSGPWWRRLCREAGGGTSGRFGPLPLWRVEHPAGEVAGELTYSQPWIGMRLTLRPLPSQ